MNKNDLFQTFLISDFYDAAKNMYYSEFISYCKEVLDKLEDLDISPKGYYYENANAIRKLHRFVKGQNIMSDVTVPLRRMLPNRTWHL